MGFLPLLISPDPIQLCFLNRSGLPPPPASVPELEEEVLGISESVGLPSNRLDHCVAAFQRAVRGGISHPGDNALHPCLDHLVECLEHRYLHHVALREGQPLLESLTHPLLIGACEPGLQLVAQEEGELEVLVLPQHLLEALDIADRPLALTVRQGQALVLIALGQMAVVFPRKLILALQHIAAAGDHEPASLQCSILAPGLPDRRPQFLDLQLDLRLLGLCGIAQSLPELGELRPAAGGRLLQAVLLQPAQLGEDPVVEVLADVEGVIHYCYVGICTLDGLAVLRVHVHGY